MRLHALVFGILFPLGLLAQGPTGAALSFSRPVSAPFNALQFFDKALEAWTWTFGKEPGAKIIRTDRASGILEGTARINFRSTMLTGREESMGTVTYLVQVQTHAGECRISVTNLAHTGNRNTASGGIHVKQLMRVDADAQKVQGLGRTNAIRLHEELRRSAEQRIGQLLQAFEARIRAQIEP
ncbi:MAG: hypothetical protein JNM62_14150 [Flavobacteriales bacterium]|nr:hypothetical protein [Flavobacteriales bacterium]